MVVTGYTDAKSQKNKNLPGRRFGTQDHPVRTFNHFSQLTIITPHNMRHITQQKGE
jgi:hypothetical protein